MGVALRGCAHYVGDAVLCESGQERQDRVLQQLHPAQGLHEREPLLVLPRQRAGRPGGRGEAGAEGAVRGVCLHVQQRARLVLQRAKDKGRAVVLHEPPQRRRVCEREEKGGHAAKGGGRFAAGRLRGGEGGGDRGDVVVRLAALRLGHDAQSGEQRAAGRLLGGRVEQRAEEPLELAEPALACGVGQRRGNRGAAGRARRRRHHPSRRLQHHDVLPHARGLFGGVEVHRPLVAVDRERVQHGVHRQGKLDGGVGECHSSER
mmetsp:Transcript_23713/g.78767  ORF Transcript_23713/g.78767 Transcript_23713/m.78767 type:complete len:262 (+) Transcript_23713:1025-1810(+)